MNNIQPLPMITYHDDITGIYHSLAIQPKVSEWNVRFHPVGGVKTNREGGTPNSLNRVLKIVLLFFIIPATTPSWEVNFIFILFQVVLEKGLQRGGNNVRTNGKQTVTN